MVVVVPELAIDLMAVDDRALEIGQTLVTDQEVEVVLVAVTDRAIGPVVAIGQG
jgi:hypothetical protein